MILFLSMIEYAMERALLNVMILEEKYLGRIYFCNQVQALPLIPVITTRDIETLTFIIKGYKATVKMDFHNGLPNIHNFP